MKESILLNKLEKNVEYTVTFQMLKKQILEQEPCRKIWADVD